MPRAKTERTIQAEPVLDQPKIETAMELMRIDHAEANELALQLGYDGALTAPALEDGIRFYQRRSVEACLELGKRLLLLRKITPHGDFTGRVELLGFSDRTAQRFMQAAAKTAQSANLAGLASQVKSASAFLELVTLDDDVLENLQTLDGIDRMSASELRSALRDAKAEAAANADLMADKNTKIDQLKAAQRRISKAKPDEELAALQKEATSLMNDALGCLRGNLRQALIALQNHSEDNGVFMAGLVGQVQADLTALRDEFSLPDVSLAADAALASEVQEWGTTRKAANA